MSEVIDKLQEFSDQGAIAALSGANKVMEYIGEGRSHLIAPYYQSICDSGDGTKLRGIREILEVMDRLEYLEERPVVYTETNYTLGETWTAKEGGESSVELYGSFEEGQYTVYVELDSDNGRYSGYVNERTDGEVRMAFDYSGDSTFGFSVCEYENGICKIEVRARNEAKLKSVRIERWIRKKQQV